MAKKKKKRPHPSPRPATPISMPSDGESRQSVAVTVAWMLSLLVTLAAEVIAIPATIIAKANPQAIGEGLTTAHLAAQESEGGLVFDYQLRPGISDQRLGMVLLEREGVAPELVSAIQRRAGRSAHNPG